MVELYKPYMPKLADLNDILYSGKIAYGPHTKLFEQKLKEYFQTEYAFVTNSFHTAISVVATALGLSYGDEIILSPMACLASTQPYASLGLKLVWADVDSKTGTLDPGSVRSKITSKTRAIVHNHFCGYVGQIDEINQIGKEYGIPVIDDGIECFGSTYKDQKVGNCNSDITIFSFTAVRFVNTIDGGGVIIRNKELYEKCLLIRDCGIDRSTFRDEMGEINPKSDISLIGYSATMSDINGYIGSKQMEDVDDLLAKHRKNAKFLDNLVAGSKDIVPLQTPCSNPNYWVYGILAKNKRAFISACRAQGIYASGVHINNNIYSVFGSESTLPGVKEFYEHFVALPCGWWVDENAYDKNLFG